MINVSNEFLNAIQQNVRFREMQKIEVSDNQNMLNSFEITEGVTSSQSLNGRLHKTNMRSMTLTIKGKHLYQGKYIKLHRGVISIQDTTTEHWIDYGVFRVIEQNYDDASNKTELILKDLMLNTHKEYKKEDMLLTFPTSLLNVFKAVANACNIQTSINTFPNSNELVDEDKWANTQYTFRDVLDHIAEVSGSQIGIRNGKLDVWQNEETGLLIDLNRGKSLHINEKFGKFNILNLTREPQHDNYPYPLDWNTIPQDDRKEWNIVNNQIVDKNREFWAPKIFPFVEELEYYTYENEVQGWGIFDVGDIVTIKTLSGELIKTVVTFEDITFNGMCISKNGAKKMASIQDEYVVVTDQRREGQTVYLIVDQQNGKIESLINQIGDRSDKTTSITQDIDSLTLMVESIGVGVNLMPNLNALRGIVDGSYPFWKFSQQGLRTKFRTKERTRTYKSPTFIVKEDSNSISGFSKEFYTKGKALIEKAYIIPDTIYSYKMKRTNGNTPLDVYIIELNENLEEIKKTKYTLDGQSTYETITFIPAQLTMWVNMEFVTSDDTKFSIAEEMFTRGNPSDYVEDAADVKAWAMTQFKMVDDTISFEANRIDTINGDIHNAGQTISALTGIEVYGKKFVIYNEGRTQKVFEVVTIDGQEQVYMFGSIQSEGGEIAFDSENREIKIGGSHMKQSSGSGFELELKTNSLHIVPAIESALNTSIFLNDKALASYVNGQSHTFAFISNLQPVSQLETVLFKNDIGRSDNRYSNLFLKNQPNVSSDKRYKRSIHNIDDMLLDSFEELEEKGFETKHDDKYSFGYIAQDVERCLYKYILKVWGYSEANQWLSKFKLLSRGESYMSLLYAEVQVIMLAVVRRQNKRLKEEMAQDRKEREQLRREHDTLIEVLKERGVI